MQFPGLRDYQQEHTQHMLDVIRKNGSALDASDTGTGKTYCALTAARELEAVPLVICPKSAIGSWHRVAKALSVDIETVGYEKMRGVRETYNVFHPSIPGPFLSRRSTTEWGREIKVGPRGSRWEYHDNLEFVIFDEVHRCGGETSLNSKLLIGARRQAKRLLCLSATAADDPRQFKALGYALKLFNLPQYRDWILRHGCVPGIFGGYDLTEDGEELDRAFAKINKEIFPNRGARMRKADIPGFPKTNIDTILLDGEEAIKAERLLQKLQQAYLKKASLAVLTDIRQRLELLRIPYWLDLAKDYAQTSKIVFFVNYTATVDELRRELPKMFDCEIPWIDGRNPDDRDRIAEDFQRNKYPALVANSDACGESIGFHDPYEQYDRTALISPQYSGIRAQQIVGRVNRDGGGYSQQFFTYFRNTIEERIAGLLFQRRDNLSKLNDAQLHGIE